MKLKPAIDMYLDYISGRSETTKTLLRARGTLSRFLQVAGNKMLDNLSPFDVSAYLAECRRLGNKRSTRDTNLKLLSGFWRWCQDSDLTDKKSPIRGFHRLRGVSHAAPRILSETEQRQIFRACETYCKPFERARARAIVTLALYCGLRRGEIANLKISDYDAEHSQLRILGKGSRQRWQPVPGIAFLHIESLLVIVHEKGFERLICSNSGNKMSEGSLFELWRRVLKKAGVAHVPFHSCRHTYACRFAAKGYNLKVIQSLLGHASLKTTEGYLRGLDVEKQKIEAVKKEFDGDAENPK